MKSQISHSLEETQKFAEEWLKEAESRHAKSVEAMVVGLSGHLGAGKTAFVKAIAKILGVPEEVTSPTFVLMKIYVEVNPRHGWKRLVHIDAYRLERREELEAIGLEKLVADKGNLVMIEWPENVGLGKDDLDQAISFEIRDGAHHIHIGN